MITLYVMHMHMLAGWAGLILLSVLLCWIADRL
jgi:hypothetical protein